MTEQLSEKKELIALNRMAAVLGESLDLNNVLETALQETMHILGVNNGAIYLLDKPSNKLIIKVQKNITDSFLSQKSVVGTDDGCAGTAYNTKELFSGFGTPEKAYICADAKELMGIDCLAAAPIIFKNEVLGILELFAPVDRKLTKQEVELLNSICSQIGVAVSNAHSHEALKYALRDSKLLLQASETIVSSLKLENILEKLINLVSELTQISRAAIWLYSEKKDILILSHHFETLPAGFSLNLKEMPGPLGTAFQDKKTVTIRDFSKTAERVEQLANMFSIKAMLAVPIVFKDRVVGLLTLDKPGISHNFDDQEIELAEGIARQAAIALENSRTFEEQRAIADTLQQSFVSLEVPDRNLIEVGTEYVSASYGAFVGGDFYDFINLDGRLGFIVGDVSGKGISATILTGVVKNSLRIMAIEGYAPNEIMYKINDVILRQSENNQFVTLFYGLLDYEKNSLSYVNAGHPLALLKKKEEMLELGFDNPPVGVEAGKDFIEKTIDFSIGDTLLLYTDGVIEARNDSELFGIERLEEIFLNNIDKDPDTISSSIFSEVSKFNKGALSDDIAILAIRRI